jgi:hypothetical protein
MYLKFIVPFMVLCLLSTVFCLVRQGRNKISFSHKQQSSFSSGCPSVYYSGSTATVILKISIPCSSDHGNLLLEPNKYTIQNAYKHSDIV